MQRVPWHPFTTLNSHKRPMPVRGMAVDVHVPGITVTNAQDAVHGNDGMAVDTHAVPGIVQPQQSQTLEMQYIAWQFDAHFLE